MTHWTVETVRALADHAANVAVITPWDGPEKALNDCASALTWALDEIRQQTWRADNFAACFNQQQERAVKAEAERDAANARAERAAVCMQVLVSTARPYLQEGHEHQNRAYLLHALDDAVKVIAELRALKTQEASK